MAANKTLQFFLQPLLKKFFQDMGRDPNNLEMILIKQKAGQLLKDSNKVIQFPQKESFMQQVERMKRSGDIVNPNNLKKNDNVLTREMFQNSNLNKVARDRDRAIKAKARIEEFDLEKGLDDLDNFRVTKDAAAAKKAIDAERAKEIEPVNERFVDYTIQDIKTKEPTEGKKIVTKIIKREGEYKDLTGIQARRILEETDDYLKGKNKPEDKADGGRIGFRAGKFVLDKVIANLLKDKKKVQQAADDIFGTGDYKMDAQMAAEALVENNPRIFKNKLYDDLDLDTQLEIYGAVLEPIQNKLSMAIKMKRATKPEKTLQSMKEGKGINMSDPEIADEFTRFMKETDPEGFKKIEQTVELSNFDPKGRKKNAKGGRIGYQEGGGIESRLEQLGGDVTSAEQLLQQINERLQSAESSLGEGVESGIGSLPRQMPIGQAPNMSPLENAMRGFGSDNQFNVTLPATLKPAIPQPGTQPQLGPTGLKLDQPFSGETVGIPEQYKAGFDEFKKGKMIMGGQAMSYSMLPDGNRVMFGDTGTAGVFSDYLKSIGAMPDNPFGPRQIAPSLAFPNAQSSSLPSSGLTSQSPLQSPLQQQQNLARTLPGLFAKGGRAGFYTGGIADIEPSLDDIGHGSDSLMARTRLMSPGNQATTSTGLNYLLAEDNDNLRVPFKVGGSGRRDFLKLLGILGGGIAGIKSGLFGMGGKEATKKAVTETVKQTAGSGTPPPYFFKLVEKIKTMGDDVTEKAATTDREKVTRFKDYELTEDITTGEQTIQKKSIEGDFDTPVPTSEEVYMNYKPGVGQADETTGKVADQYVEDTSYIGTSRGNKGEIIDTVDGVPDEVIQEGTMFEDNITEFGKTKKAEGGRIGFAGGKLATFLADKTITGSSRRFLEKIFGKGSLDEMLKRDPNMHRGMLEVVEMFRKRDKEGLKMYMQKFLPHMDDETVEAFIRGDATDLAGQGKYGLDNIQGQLIRLGSGRDYAEKIELMKKADNMRKLNALDVKDRKPNASGGVAKLLGE